MKNPFNVSVRFNLAALGVDARLNAANIGMDKKQIPKVTRNLRVVPKKALL
jgi:hypothetical protein